MAALAAHLRAHRQDRLGLGQHPAAGLVPGGDGEEGIGVHRAVVAVGHQRDAGRLEEAGLVVVGQGAVHPLARGGEIGLESLADQRLGVLPEVHVGRRPLEALRRLIAQLHPLADHLRGLPPLEEDGAQGVARGQEGQPGVAVGDALHAQGVPGQEHVFILGGVEGRHGQRQGLDRHLPGASQGLAVEGGHEVGSQGVALGRAAQKVGMWPKAALAGQTASTPTRPSWAVGMLDVVESPTTLWQADTGWQEVAARPPAVLGGDLRWRTHLPGAGRAGRVARLVGADAEDQVWTGSARLAGRLPEVLELRSPEAAGQEQGRHHRPGKERQPDGHEDRPG